MKNYDKRLEKLESNPAQQWRDVRCLICQGRYYDELTADQRQRYCEYRGIERNAFEEVETAVSGSLHFRLEPKPDSPAPSKLRHIITQLQTIFEKR